MSTTYHLARILIHRRPSNRCGCRIGGSDRRHPDGRTRHPDAE